MIYFNISTTEVIEFTNKLTRIGRTALPAAAAETLNKVAFDTKARLPAVAKSRFITRNKSFIRKFTLVKPTRSRNLKGMKSQVGVNANIPKGNRVARGLAKQETGGMLLYERAFVPMEDARIAKSERRMIQKRNRIGNLGLVSMNGSPHIKWGNEQQFVQAAIMAKKTNKAVLYGRHVYKINSARKNKNTGETEIESTKIYRYKKGRRVAVGKRAFIYPTAKQEAKNMDAIYKKQATRQIRRYR